MSGPLDGVRIADLTQVLAGPFGTMLLADQGAEVIKIEPLHGDLLRAGEGYRKGGLNAFTANNNRGKKSIAVDLRKPEGLAIVRSLISTADVFSQNFRPGVVERLGLGVDGLRVENSRLITLSMSGYGASGPHSGEPVYDPIIQAATGHISVQTSSADGPVDAIRSAVIDKTAALMASQAVTAALFARERTGIGQHIDINMLDVGTSFFWPDGMMSQTFLDDDVTPGRTVAELYHVTECSDRQIMYWTATGNDLQGVYAALECPELIDDPQLSWPECRDNQAKYLEATEPRFGRLTADEAIEKLTRNDVPVAKVLRIDEVHQHAQVVHNGKVIEWEHPTAGAIRQALPAATFSGTPNEPWLHAPLLGSHTDEILSELGHQSAAIHQLRAGGVVA